MGVRFSEHVQTGPGAHPASCTMGTVSFPGVKNGRGVTLTPHSLLVQWSRKSRPTPLLPLRAVRPVQSLSTCTSVHCTFTFHCGRPFAKYTQCLKIFYLILPLICNFVRGTAVAQWLRCCATNRKVSASIPDGVIGIFY